MPRLPNLPTASNISSDDLIVLYDNTGDITGKATLSQAVTAGGAGLIGTGDMILSAAQTVTGAKQFNPNTLLDKGNIVYNVKAYSATGNGTTDDTTAIQQAIDAAHNAVGGGTVYFPAGTYKITSALTVYTGTTLRGVSTGSSFITQATANTHGIVGVDVQSVTIEDLFLTGTGGGTGVGVRMTRSVASNIPYLSLNRVWVRDFGSHGIHVDTPIVSQFNRVTSAENGGNGFNISHGTSTTFTACYGNANAHAGYYLDSLQYSSLVGCAADSNGIGYDLVSCASISMVACGAEATTYADATWDGTSIKLSACLTIGIKDVFIYGNNAVGIWVTGSSTEVVIDGVLDSNPGGSATNFLKVGSGSLVTILSIANQTANSLAAGTVVLNLYGGTLTATGATLTGQQTTTISGASAATAAVEAIVDTSTASQPAIYARNLTNYAHGAEAIKAKLQNATDSGNVVRIENSGTGKNISSASGTSETFSVSKAGAVVAADDISISTAGKGLKVAEGSNAKMGTATLVAGTVTVNTTAVTNNSRIFLTAQTLGTVTTGQGLAVSARTAGTSFTITSGSASDTSSVAWMIVEPA